MNFFPYFEKSCTFFSYRNQKFLYLQFNIKKKLCKSIIFSFNNKFILLIILIISILNFENADFSPLLKEKDALSSLHILLYRGSYDSTMSCDALCQVLYKKDKKQLKHFLLQHKFRHALILITFLLWRIARIEEIRKVYLSLI